MSCCGQTLKSALTSRVRNDQAQRLGSQRQDAGEGLMCPAGAGDIAFDVYGRPVSQKTLRLDDAACSQYTEWSAARRIEVENFVRPQVGICAAGQRGAADFMGVGRDLIPQDLYGTGYEGNFVRHYPTPNNAPWDQEPNCPSDTSYLAVPRVQPWTGSMDATSKTWRG